MKAVCPLSKAVKGNALWAEITSASHVLWHRTTCRVKTFENKHLNVTAHRIRQVYCGIKKNTE